MTDINSRIKERFTNSEGHRVLVDDSGYPCRLI